MVEVGTDRHTDPLGTGAQAPLNRGGLFFSNKPRGKEAYSRT